MSEAGLEAGSARGRARIWLLLLGVPVAIGCALVPFASVRALGAPLWAATIAALLVFPIVPLAWHFLAERGRGAGALGPALPLERLALRSLTVGVLVVAVSLANLGARRVGVGLAHLVRPPKSVAPPPAPTATSTPRDRRHPLESFIPADATMVVALSDAAVIQQFVGSEGGDAEKKLAALEKCQILARDAYILIATRDQKSRLVVLRAPGVTDQRNLYCLVGVLGTEALHLRFTSDKPPVRFEVEGLLPEPLRFEAVDDRTVMMVDAAWDSAGKKLFSADTGVAAGPLGTVLARVDRGATLWAAAITAGAAGTFDLALDARLEGAELGLRASSIPPSGISDRATASLQVPLGFARALPQGALGDGVRGVAAIVAAAGAGSLIDKRAPAAKPQP